MAALACLTVTLSCAAGPAVTDSGSSPAVGAPSTATDGSLLPGEVVGDPGDDESASVQPLADYCAADPPEGVTQRQLAAGDTARLNTAWLGSGSTVAILLPGDDEYGMCGLLFYADYLAQHDVRSVLVDLCGFGQSDCSGDRIADDPAAQVKVVADAVRSDGASRMVLVGTSTGGTLAVMAAKSTRPDALVSLSAPRSYGGKRLATYAGNVTMPALFAYSSQEQADLTEVRRLLPKMPSQRKTLLRVDDGHGYDLLHEEDSAAWTPLASQVLKFIRQAP